MVQSCSAYGCTNRYGKFKENAVQGAFHRFPLHKPFLLNKWLTAIRRKSWTPNKHSCLCSNHFTDDCYKTIEKHYLKDDAVPSIFSFSDRQKVQKKRRTIVKYSVSTSAKKPKCNLVISQPDIAYSNAITSVAGPSSYEINAKQPKCELEPDLEISQPGIPNSNATSVAGPSSYEISAKKSKCDLEPDLEISQPDIANSNAIIRVAGPDSYKTSGKKPKCDLEPDLEISQPDIANSNAITSVPGLSRPEVSPVHVPIVKEGVKSEETEKDTVTKAMLRRKIKILQQRLKRRDKKISSLLNILTISRKVNNRKMTDEMSDMLQEKFGLIPDELLVNRTKNPNYKPIIVTIESIK